MPIELKMPALSPTMEEGTLAKWLVKEGDTVAAGDLLAEIETDKATMEFEAVDEGTIAKILVAEGTDEVKVGTVIALIAGEGESAEQAPAPQPAAKQAEAAAPQAAPTKRRSGRARRAPKPQPRPRRSPRRTRPTASRRARSPAASPSRKASTLPALTGSGPGGRIVKADIDGSSGQGARRAGRAPAAAPAAAPLPPPSMARRTFRTRRSSSPTCARRSPAGSPRSKQTIPHIYLTVDIQLDALLKLRSELNKRAREPRREALVNDMLIKALAAALIEVPECNVAFAGDQLLDYQPRRHLGRGVDPGRPDHADRQRRRQPSRSRPSRRR